MGALVEKNATALTAIFTLLMVVVLSIGSYFDYRTYTMVYAPQLISHECKCLEYIEFNRTSNIYVGISNFGGSTGAFKIRIVGDGLYISKSDEIKNGNEVEYSSAIASEGVYTYSPKIKPVEKQPMQIKYEIYHDDRHGKQIYPKISCRYEWSLSMNKYVLKETV